MSDDDPLASLISQLEQAVDDMGIAEFASGADQPPREGTYTLEKNAYTTRSLQRPFPALMYAIHDGVCTMQVQEALVRGQKLSLDFRMRRDAKGDTRLVATGLVTKSAKITGRYEVQVTVDDLQRVVEPINRIFMQYAHNGDFARWNRWSAELTEGACLQGLMLSGTRLAYFDLCCADLSGCNLRNANMAEANLAGANLSGCNLAGASFEGADLFGALIPRKHMGILHQAGLIELESVTFTND